MKHTYKDFLHGGLFTLVANLIAFVWFTSAVIFSFDWYQQLTLLGILFLPGCIYCAMTRKRSFFFPLGALIGSIVMTVISLLLAPHFGDAYIDFVETLLINEPGLLFGLGFVVDFFLRVIALTVPPVIDLLVRGIRWLLHRSNQKTDTN